VENGYFLFILFFPVDGKWGNGNGMRIGMADECDPSCARGKKRGREEEGETRFEPCNPWVERGREETGKLSFFHCPPT
jgi:hypothetical protein